MQHVNALKHQTNGTVGSAAHKTESMNLTQLTSHLKGGNKAVGGKGLPPGGENKTTVLNASRLAGANGAIKGGSKEGIKAGGKKK